jgi:hypothetical protein
MTTTPESLITAVRAKGSDASDLRDAAHEACHALSWRVSAPWTRDNIHAKKPKPHRIFGDMPGIREEILARAVEQLVCVKLGVDCGTVSRWALVCWMEMLKNERVSLPTGDWLEAQIRDAMGTALAEDMAKAVLRLAEPKKRRAGTRGGAAKGAQ